MSRLVAAAACFALLAISAAELRAQGDGDDAVFARAEELNNQGRELFAQGDLEAAAHKFRAAIGLSPQARYYFNLCFLLNARGELEAALGACAEVARARGTDDRLRDRAKKLTASIEKKRAAKGETSKPSPYPKTKPQPKPAPKPKTKPQPKPTTLKSKPRPKPIPVAQRNLPPPTRPRARYSVPMGRPPAVATKKPEPPPRRIHVGIYGGFSSSELEGDTTFSVRPGLALGAWVSSSLSKPIAVVIETAYVQRGVDGAFISGPGAPVVDGDIALDYLTVPLLARYMLPIGNAFKLHFESGVGLSFLLSHSFDDGGGVLAEPDSTDVGYILGGGITIHRRAGRAWSVNLRYERGFREPIEGLGTNRSTTLMLGFAW